MFPYGSQECPRSEVQSQLEPELGRGGGRLEFSRALSTRSFIRKRLMGPQLRARPRLLQGGRQ